jgi:hypothetical protein
MSTPSKQVELWWGEKEMGEAIFEYLAEHPLASDTLEGIAEWWIMRQSIRVEVNKVAKVLCHLAESSLLEKIEEGENPRFRLKVEKHGLPS